VEWQSDFTGDSNSLFISVYTHDTVSQVNFHTNSMSRPTAVQPNKLNTKRSRAWNSQFLGYVPLRVVIICITSLQTNKYWLYMLEICNAKHQSLTRRIKLYGSHVHHSFISSILPGIPSACDLLSRWSVCSVARVGSMRCAIRMGWHNVAYTSDTIRRGICYQHKINWNQLSRNHCANSRVRGGVGVNCTYLGYNTRLVVHFFIFHLSIYR
jgi:hypothetical protein